MIVGAAKSGTTTLAELLAEHPDGFVMPDKEAHFFDLDERWALGVDWYRERFSEHRGQRAVGEATPNYLAAPRAIDRMASVVPNARLIAILRNPVDRAYSQYWHWRIRLARERRSFPEAIEQELGEGAEQDRGVDARNEQGPRYVADGVYLPQLLRVCERYPRESLLVLLLEDLEEQPAATFACVCRFLGIDDAVAPAKLGSVVNPHVQPRFERLWRLMYERRLWRHIPRRLLPAVLHVITRPAGHYPPMEPALRKRLTRHFAEPNAALSEWLGRDLGSWEAAQRSAGCEG